MQALPCPVTTLAIPKTGFGAASSSDRSHRGLAATAQPILCLGETQP
jgi:hypothetical protein